MMILNEVFFYPSYITDAYVKGEFLQLLQNNTLEFYSGINDSQLQTVVVISIWINRI